MAENQITDSGPRPRAEADLLMNSLEESNGGLVLETTINGRTNYYIYSGDNHGWAVYGPDVTFDISREDVREQIWNGRIWHVNDIDSNTE